MNLERKDYKTAGQKKGKGESKRGSKEKKKVKIKVKQKLDYEQKEVTDPLNLIIQEFFPDISL